MTAPDPSSRYFWQGVRAMIPLTVGIVPFGIVFGAAIADGAMGAPTGIASSLIILAGASQLTIAQLLDEGSSWIVVVSAALFINARFALYSAALSPAFSSFPRRWRYGLPLVLTDQSASVSLLYFEAEPSERRRRWFFLGTGIGLVTFWMIGTIVGAVGGASIPESWQLDFAVPLMFLALLIPNLKDSPTVAAALGGAIGTVATVGLPTGLNIIAGAVAGIGVGAAMNEWKRRS